MNIQLLEKYKAVESPFASPCARQLDLQEDRHQGLSLWKPVLARHCEQHFYVRMQDAHSLIPHPNATVARQGDALPA